MRAEEATGLVFIAAFFGIVAAFAALGFLIGRLTA